MVAVARQWLTLVPIQGSQNREDPSQQWPSVRPTTMITTQVQNRCDQKGGPPIPGLSEEGTSG